MELINNTTKTLKDDLSVEIKQGSKLSIAAACFSIYAFQELKKQLTSIEELRFIFTSPTFVAEKTKKDKKQDEEITRQAVKGAELGKRIDAGEEKDKAQEK